MGLIMVIGIVAKNGILLLDANEKFRAQGMSLEEAIVQAGRRRLRPIVMTALAAVAGMLPLALALGAGSQMLQPLAIAVIGGILISMVLSLIVTPAIQYFLDKNVRSAAYFPSNYSPPRIVFAPFPLLEEGEKLTRTTCVVVCLSGAINGSVSFFRPRHRGASRCVPHNH